MTEHSLWESKNRNRQEQAFGITLGKITAVDVPSRTCSIVTFMGQGTLNDQVINSCQWLNADANPDGDESGCIPRRGSMGLVFFVGGETFIWGFMRPQAKGGSAAQGPESPMLNEGDKIISTKAGNRITIKRSGFIELFSKDTLQRLMFPLGGKIVDMCQYYNLKADGGTIEWGADVDTGMCLYDAEFRQSLGRYFVVREQKGYISSDIICRTTVGPAFPGAVGTSTPTYTHTIGINGETVTTVSPPQPEGTPIGYKSTIGPDGSITVLSGTGQTVIFTISATGETKLSVNSIAEASVSASGDIALKNKVGEATISATGDIAIKNKVAEATMASAGDIALKNKVGEATIAAAGDIALKNKVAKLTMSSKGDIEISSGSFFTMTVSATGEVKIDAKGKATIAAMKGLDITVSAGPVKIEAGGPIDIKAKGTVKIDTGAGATDNVLTYPTTLSPFTGAPLMPYSTTVMVSK